MEGVKECACRITFGIRAVKFHQPYNGLSKQKPERCVCKIPMPEQCTTILVCHVGKFLQRLELEENIQMQAVILRYLMTQSYEHVFFVAFFRQNLYVEYIEQDFLVKVYSATGYVTCVALSYASSKFWGQST